ncbi:hypothetical protein ACFFX0_23135 [Citricoccus parietis]|uniref:Uncharacterized protein n=1 Tax=Citricoccus parietis TaxID=592307 RepID=A0ABV5G4S9_9MICC
MRPSPVATSPPRPPGSVRPRDGCTWPSPRRSAPAPSPTAARGYRPCSRRSRTASSGDGARRPRLWGRSTGTDCVQ